MPGIDFDKLRREITMEQVLDLLRFEPLRQRGDQWYGRCPLTNCPSQRPVFSVNVALRSYWCYRCRRGGNQLELWTDATNTPLHPAMIELCGALGRPVPWIERW